MGFADHYLEKQNSFFFGFTDYEDADIDCCIVIPCFNEDKLIETLNSLWNCERSEFNVLVIIVINSSEASNDEIRGQNKKTIRDFIQWKVSHFDNKLRFEFINYPNLPKKFAGAGLARKIGMDIAVKLFNDNNFPEGLIISLDADCIVAKNYITAIEAAFKKEKHAQCAVIYFEHPLEGNEYNEKMSLVIAGYELHLRYHIQYLRLINYPNTYHTIGSCFAVKAQTYLRHGGMNKKLAGEDFYFLQKLFPVVETIEINDTIVYPSSRISTRVPFGTGSAVKKILDSDEEIMNTYHPQAYEDLQKLITMVPMFYRIKKHDLKKTISTLPKSINSFLSTINTCNKIKEINQNTGNINSFIKRFYSWFNAFMVVKYLNYTKIESLSNIPVSEAAGYLINKMNIEFNSHSNDIDLLKIFREIQRNQKYSNPLLQ